jgi:hypothetical protein
MLGGYKLSRSKRVREIAAGSTSTAAAITGVCLLLVLDTFRDRVLGVLSTKVLVGVFIWFALYGPGQRLASKLVTWWY